MTNLASNPRAWRTVKAPSLADLEVLAGEIFRRLPRRFRDLCPNIVVQVAAGLASPMSRVLQQLLYRDLLAVLNSRHVSLLQGPRTNDDQ